MTKLTGRHLCWSLCFNKVARMRHGTLSKKRLRHICFPVTFDKLSRKSFLLEHLLWLFFKYEQQGVVLSNLCFLVVSQYSINVFYKWTRKPRVHISEEFLVMLKEVGYSWRKIADIFIVSERTILRMYRSIMHLNLISKYIFYLSIYFSWICILPDYLNIHFYLFEHIC